MKSYHNSIKKRGLDIIFTLLVLPIALPLLIACLFLVLITMGFPLIFSQKRIGKKGKEFTMYKLRSMKKKFVPSEGQKHSNNDISKIGKLLRMSRLDELPQMWNILKGDMSWVGPRPEVPFYVDKYKELHPRYIDRQKVLPGIAGLAQLSNPNATPDDNLDKLGYDLQYIDKANLMTDIKIILKTFFVLWK
jgi:lipopolysaccharide/colanic/teichoic acid biosynthesis glycosyltransferase